MASASQPTRYSLGSCPCLAIYFSTSSGSSLRLLLAMSQVPLMRLAMPMPDPPPETSTDTLGSILWYSSDQACARFTMVSEPMFCTAVALVGLEAEAEVGAAPGSLLPQPLASRPAARLMALKRMLRWSRWFWFMVVCWVNGGWNAMPRLIGAVADYGFDEVLNVRR